MSRVNQISFFNSLKTIVLLQRPYILERTLFLLELKSFLRLLISLSCLSPLIGWILDPCYVNDSGQTMSVLVIVLNHKLTITLILPNRYLCVLCDPWLWFYYNHMSLFFWSNFDSWVKQFQLRNSNFVILLVKLEFFIAFCFYHIQRFYNRRCLLNSDVGLLLVFHSFVIEERHA